MKYKESIVNYYLNYKGNKYIYNTLTESLCRLHDSIDIQNPLLEAVKNGFVIASETDEIDYLKQIRLNSIFNSPNIYFRIMTTSFCNAHCYYCYEKFQNCSQMSEKTAIDLADFIFEKSKHKKHIILCWFGGEPF